MKSKTKKYFRFTFSLATAALLATAIFVIPIASFADTTSPAQSSSLNSLIQQSSTPQASYNSEAQAAAAAAGAPASVTNPIPAASTSNNGTSSAASCGTDSTICNPIAGGKVNDIPSLIVLVIKYLVALIGIVAVLMIIVGGYQMVTSAGNEEGYKKAKQTITYAVIGLVIAVLSYSVAAIVENTLGANLGAPATSSVSSSSSTSGTPSAAAGTPAATTNGSSSSGSNGSTTNSSNGSSNNNGSQSASNPASGSNCTAAVMEGINIVILDPTPVPIDPNNGGKVEYKITPDNDIATGCQVSVNTYILEGSASWNSSLQPNDTASSLNTPNTLDISEQYSQDPSLTIYSRFTDSTGAVRDTYANLSLTQTSQNSNAGN